MIHYRLNDYSVLAFSGADQPVRVYLYGDAAGGGQSSYFGYIEFTDKIDEKFVVHNNGIINAFMPIDRLHTMLELLRKESPLYFVVNEQYNWAGLKTGKEPTGEEEVPQV